MIERAPGQLAATFRRPPPSFGPVPAWWWSAERLANDRLEWQLRQFRSAGLSEVMICSFGYRQPVGGFPPDDPPFFSEEWWSCVRHVASVADEPGMRLWFWDHLGTFGDPTP